MIVVRLVGAAEYLNSRTHGPHHILLELKSHGPRPITRGKSSHVTSKPSQSRSLGDPQSLLDAQTMTPNRLEDTQSSKVTSIGSTQEQSLQ